MKQYHQETPHFLDTNTYSSNECKLHWLVAKPAAEIVLSYNEFIAKLETGCTCYLQNRSTVQRAVSPDGTSSTDVWRGRLCDHVYYV